MKIAWYQRSWHTYNMMPGIAVSLAFIGAAAAVWAGRCLLLGLFYTCPQSKQASAVACADDVYLLSVEPCGFCCLLDVCLVVAVLTGCGVHLH